MCVHQARDEGFVVGEFNDFRAGEPVAKRHDRGDPAAAHTHLTGRDAGRGEDAPATDDKVKVFFRH
ncbi:hypothetical protein D3C84_1307700 [compost metagenome]